jgi:uncharacterized protein YndB with AHSA1/START domain
MTINKELSLTISIEINACPEAVWDAITNPEKVKIYFFGMNLITDWKAGNPISFEGEYEDNKYKDKGHVIKIEKAKYLVYDYWSSFSQLEDVADNYSTVIYELQRNDKSTILNLSQIGFATPEAKAHSIEAWNMILEKMKELVENDKPNEFLYI